MAYGFAALIVVSLPGVSIIGTAVWPSAGIAQALTIALGWRVWPAIPLGIEIFDWINPGKTIFLLAIFGIPGATFQALLSHWILQAVGFDRRFRRVSDATWFLLVGVLGATQLNCTLGTFSICLAGEAPWSAFWDIRWGWWLGDAIGVLIFTPLLLLWGEAWRDRWHRLTWEVGQRLKGVRLLVTPQRRPIGWLDLAWLVLLVIVAGWTFVLARPSAAAVRYPLEYAPLPIVVWGALRYGPRGGCLAAFVVSVLALTGAALNAGPFLAKSTSTKEAILLLQAFIGTISSTALLLAGTVAERAAAEASLRQLNEDLEARVARRTAQLRLERDRADRLLRNVLPAAIIDRFAKEQLADQPLLAAETIAEIYDEAVVLFADIVNFTSYAAEIPPLDLLTFLNNVFSRFDRLAQEYGLEKIKTIGDAYMVVAGLPEPHPDGLGAIAHMALAMQAAIADFPQPDGTPFALRIGIHVGPAVAGIVGSSKFSYDLWGDTVNVASRMEATGQPGKIQVTAEVYRHLRDRFSFAPRGVVRIKGKGWLGTYWLLGSPNEWV